MDGLIQRIKRVNFGIYEHRYSLDKRAQRLDLLYIDSIIPWVFSYHDLMTFATTHGKSPAIFPGENLLMKNTRKSQSTIATHFSLHRKTLQKKELVRRVFKALRRSIVFSRLVFSCQMH